MRAYAKILRIPGAFKFCAFGLIARFGGAMLGIGIVLMVSELYGSYGIAGDLVGANSIAWAIGTAYLSHLVDRHGQRRIMRPALLLSAAATAGLVVVAVIHAPLPYLFAFAILSGLTTGSPGALVRARWNYVLTSSKDLHTAYAMESTLDEVCYIVGPVLATWLATTFHPATGMVGPVVFFAGGAILFFSQHGTEPKILARETNEHGRATFLLTYPGYAPLVGVGLLIGSLFGSIDLSVVAAMTEWEVRPLAGVILAITSLGSGIGGFLYGIRGWTSPIWKRFLIGVTILGVSSISIPFVTTPILLGACGFVVCVMVAPTFVNANGLIGQLVPKSRMTEGFAWFLTAIGLGVSLGSALSGSIIDSFGYQGGFVCVTASALASCAVGLIFAPTLKRAVERGVEIESDPHCDQE